VGESEREIVCGWLVLGMLLDLHLNSQCLDGRLGDEGLRLMHLVPAPAVRLSCKDECYPDQALTVYWLKDNMRLVWRTSIFIFILTLGPDLESPVNIGAE